MTTVNLSLFAGAGGQFFDDNGVPLAGGLLYTYQAGTSSNLTTYTSSSGSVANSNPIVLDSGGRVPNEIWLIGGDSYKFVLENSVSVVIGTWDNIPGANSIAYPVTVANGGTGTNTLTANAVMLGNGVNPPQFVTAGVSGNILQDNGTTWVSVTPSYLTTTAAAATYAPLASPTLTGTPLAPTAASNTSTTQIATTAFANPGSSLVSGGYQKLPSGLVMQWGSISATTSGATFTFPTAFATACLTVQACNAGGASSSTVVAVGSPSTTTVTVYSETGTVTANIFAIGH
jgi:hypothetical protein